MGIKVDLEGIHRTNFIDTIMADEVFQETLTGLAAETDRSIDDVAEQARANLDELAAEQASWAINTWDGVARWLGRAYKLDVHEEQVAHLRELNQSSTLVFLPNHRSYLDPLVLRSALEKEGFPPNHTLGGVNLAFWPLGSIGRRNGTVFIRRQFKDDLVYKATLKEYMAYLVRHKQNLEWYIEGGRTRTGKLRPPRMGILSYLVDAFDSATQEDVLLIPVFVGYDQQYEVGAISAEEQGGKKAPESVKWLVKFARAQTARRGRAHLRFGEPLSLREALAESRESTDSDDARLAVPKVAFEVCHRINKVTAIMPSALVTFALLDNDDRAITLTEGRNILTPLMKYIRRRGLDLRLDIDLSEHGGLQGAVYTLVREGVIEQYEGGTEPVFRIAEKRAHEAAYYRNTLIHYFITRAIVEVALIRAAEEEAPDATEATWDEAVRLRDLMKYEFFFPRTRDFAAEVINEADLAVPDWEDKAITADELIPLMAGGKLFMAHRVLGPFIEAYAVFADRLVAWGAEREVDRDELILECIGVGQQRWLQHDLHSPESISRDLFSGAFQLADNRRLIELGDERLQSRRENFAEELHSVVRRIDIIRDMARQKEEV